MSEALICHTPEQTFALGEEFGRALKAGDIVLLQGELGAGKTLFAKGILQGMGFDADDVTSPSFSLVNLYKVNGTNVYHIDLWRIDESADAAFAVGLNELTEEDNAVIIIEWPERLGEYKFSSNVKRVVISGEGDGDRQIVLS